MKFKKLLSLLASAAIALSYSVTAGVFSASAAIEQDHAQYKYKLGSTYRVLTTDFLADEAEDNSTIVLPISSEDNTLNSVLTLDDIDVLVAVGNLTQSIVEEYVFTLDSETAEQFNTKPFKATIKLDDLKIAANNATYRANINANNGIRLDLNFKPDTKNYKYTVSRSEQVPSTDKFGIEVNYNFNPLTWLDLVNAANIPYKQEGEIAVYPANGPATPRDKDDLLNTFQIKLNDDNKPGIYLTYKEAGNTGNYVNKKEAIQIVEDLLMDYMGLSEAQIEGSDPNFTNQKKYIDDAVSKITAEGGLLDQKYVSKDELENAVKDYFVAKEVPAGATPAEEAKIEDENKERKKHREELAKAIVADSALNETIISTIYEQFGLSTSTQTVNKLFDPIRDEMEKYILQQLGTYSTNPADMAKAVQAIIDSNVIDDSVKSLKDQLKQIESQIKAIYPDVDDIVSGDKSVRDMILELMTTSTGDKPGSVRLGNLIAYEIADALDLLTKGETVEDWALTDVLPKLGVETAYQYAKEAWEKEHKNTDEEWPYKTVSAWIDSFKGEKGKSAYEIAKEEFEKDPKNKGKEFDSIEKWLESLNGTNGENGKDAYDVARDAWIATHAWNDPWPFDKYPDPDRAREEWRKSLQGETGLTAYEEARQKDPTLTYEKWLEKFKGDTGDTAYEEAKKLYPGLTYSQWLDMIRGEKGETGNAGEDFLTWVEKNYGTIGAFMNEVAKIAATQVPSGKSAYDIAVENGFNGTERAWLESLKGEDGLSAYEVAREYGYKGTEEEWLESLRGENGYSAYDIAVENGFQGTELEWLNSLAGEDSSVVYINGAYGPIPVDGDDPEVIYEDEDYEGDGDYITEVDGNDDYIVDPDDADYEDILIIPSNRPSSSDNGYNRNPATGVAVGILIPAAAVSSVLLVKKQKRRRCRK